MRTFKTVLFSARCFLIHDRANRSSEQLGGHVSFGIRQYIILPKFNNLLLSSEIPGQYKHVTAFQMTALRKENFL